jgi:hypothetical protein
LGRLQEETNGQTNTSHARLSAVFCVRNSRCARARSAAFKKNPTHPKKLQHIAVSKNMMQK